MWTRIGILNIIQDSIQEDRSGSVVLENLLRKEETMVPGYTNINLQELITVTCWYLWWIRRRRTHGEEVPPPDKCMLSILSITANSDAAYRKKRQSQEVKWSKPNPRQVKLNVDASFHGDCNAGAVAAVIRDFQGGFLVARYAFVPHVASASLAEAMAMREGLSLANDMGCNDLIAEST
jgi:hypothetical protein